MRNNITTILCLTFFAIAGMTATLVSAAPPAAAQQQEIVEFRLITTKTMHAHDENAARQFHATLLQLGCEARLDGHGDHFDLSYRCADWKRAQFADHASAHKWQAWLQSLGFEVSHQH